MDISDRFSQAILYTLRRRSHSSAMERIEHSNSVAFSAQDRGNSYRLVVLGGTVSDCQKAAADLSNFCRKRVHEDAVDLEPTVWMDFMANPTLLNSYGPTCLFRFSGSFHDGTLLVSLNQECLLPDRVVFCRYRSIDRMFMSSTDVLFADAERVVKNEMSRHRWNVQKRIGKVNIHLVSNAACAEFAKLHAGSSQEFQLCVTSAVSDSQRNQLEACYKAMRDGGVRVTFSTASSCVFRFLYTLRLKGQLDSLETNFLNNVDSSQLDAGTGTDGYPMSVGKCTVTVKQGDITKEPCGVMISSVGKEATVKASGAMFKSLVNAGGQAFADACAKTQVDVKTGVGKTVVPDGCPLPCKEVLHVQNHFPASSHATLIHNALMTWRTDNLVVAVPGLFSGELFCVSSVLGLLCVTIYPAIR